MTSALLLLAASAVSINTGWQPGPNGEMEYIIQIEPQLLKSLQPGDDVVSEIPVDLRNVRRYRIKVGTGELPRIRPHGEVAGSAAPPAVAKPKQSYTEPPKASVLNRPRPKGDARRTALPDDDDSPLASNPIDEMPPADSRAETTLPTEDDNAENGPKLSLTAPLIVDKDDFAKSESPKLPTRDDDRASSDDEPKRIVPIQKPLPLTADDKREQLASHNRVEKKSAAVAAPVTKSQQRVTPVATTAAEPKPWLPMILTLMGLIASIGANVYLGWQWIDTRRRYFQLAHTRRAAV